jgi:hypothetical protein
MLKLEQLESGVQIRGIIPNQNVTIVSISSFLDAVETAHTGFKI